MRFQSRYRKGEYQHNRQLKYGWWEKLAKMSDGNATVDGLIGAIWTPARLEGENTRAQNIRHAEVLDQLADQIKEFANMLRDPDVIYEDELADKESLIHIGYY